jgi:predicted dehydrogenase
VNRKLAIVGCGAVSEMWHIAAAIELLGAGNVVIVDNDLKRLEIVAQKFDVSSTSSELSNVKTSLDAVVIAAPPHTHPSIAEEAFELGLHVLCEKPLANTSVECRRIFKAVRSSHKVLAVCHTYRFFPNRLRLREMILSGKLGRIQSIDIQQGDPASWPTVTGYSFKKEHTPGGVLLIEGLHSLDFLLWCFGKPKDLHYTDDSLGGLESNALLRIDYEDSCKASFRVSRTCKLSNRITVTGEIMTIELDIYDMVNMKIISNGGGTVIECREGGCDFKAMAITQLSDFVSSIEEKKKPMCDGLEGSSVVELIEKCYESKRSRPLPKKAPIPGLMW